MWRCLNFYGSEGHKPVETQGLAELNHINIDKRFVLQMTFMQYCIQKLYVPSLALTTSLTYAGLTSYLSDRSIIRAQPLLYTGCTSWDAFLLSVVVKGGCLRYHTVVFLSSIDRAGFLSQWCGWKSQMSHDGHWGLGFALYDQSELIQSIAISRCS